MSNETKRDVFGQLLNAYQNLIVKDNEIHDENYRENVTTPWNIVYDAALPDDLPVIPKAVGKYIKTNRGHMSLTSGIENASCISEWLWGKGFDYGNDSVFARAWVLGVWRVEETGEIVKLEEEK